MNLREAAMLALEAIEQGEPFQYLDDVVAPALRLALATIQSEIKEDKQPAQSIDKTDIRTAAAKALEALEWYREENRDIDGGTRWDWTDDAARDLRNVLASRPQPYAWMYVDETGMKFVSVDRPHLDCVPLYTRP